MSSFNDITLKIARQWLIMNVSEIIKRINILYNGEKPYEKLIQIYQSETKVQHTAVETFPMKMITS